MKRKIGQKRKILYPTQKYIYGKKNRFVEKFYVRDIGLLQRLVYRNDFIKCLYRIRYTICHTQLVGNLFDALIKYTTLTML